MASDQTNEPPDVPAPQSEAPLPEPRQQARSGWSVLSRLRAALTMLRKFIVDLAVVGPAVAVIGFFVFVLVDDSIVIEAPSVPQPIADRGLTPDLLTELLQARLYEIQETAETSKSPETAGPGLETVSIQTAGLNFSVNSLALVVRRILGTGRQRVLKMRVACPTPDCRDDVLHLYAVSYVDDVVLKTATVLDMDDIAPAMEVVSSHFLLSFDPHLLAIHHLRLADSEPPSSLQRHLKYAEQIATKMVRERHPQTTWAFNVLGIVETRCRNYDVAKAYFDQALRMDETFVPAMVNIGSIYARNSDSTGAIAAYRRALAADPDNVYAYINLGSIFKHSGDWVEATEAYEKAFEIDPGVSSVLSGLAEIKTHAGDGAAAASFQQLVDPPKAPALDYIIEYASYCRSRVSGFAAGAAAD